MTISIINNKGGVGKTTTAVNLAAGLCRQGNRVLLIDADPQGSATICCGLNPLAVEETMYDMFVNRKVYKVTLSNGVDICPANISLAKINTRDNFTTLRRFFRGIGTYAKGKYDYVIIDCPPELGPITSAILTATDKIIIPVRPEMLSLCGLGNISQAVESARKVNPNLDILGILATFYKRRNHYDDILREIDVQYPGLRFKSAIRESIAVAEAPYAGEDVFTYASSSAGSHDYTTLIEEIKDRLGNETK